MQATPTPAAGAVFTERPLWNRAWLIVGVFVLSLLVAFFFVRGASTIYYVLMGWFIALAMEPAVATLSRWMKRGLATGLVMILAGLALVVFLWVFGSLFVDQVTSFIGALPQMAEDALAWLNRVTGSTYTFDTILERLGITAGDIAAYADDVAFGLLGVIASILSGFFGIFILLFFVFYMSAGMPSLRRWIALRMRPELQVPFLAAWDLTKIKVGGYIAARIVLAAINSFLSGIVFALVGLPYWLPLALWTGLVAQFVPNIGTYISIALPVLVGLTSGDPIIGVYVLIWGIAYQQVENLTIEPRISARAVNLHPAVSFGSALLGAQLFGLSGALLAVPVSATAMAMLEIYKRRYELTAETEQRVAVLVAPSTEEKPDAGDAPSAASAPSAPPPPPRPSPTPASSASPSVSSATPDDAADAVRADRAAQE